MPTDLDAALERADRYFMGTSDVHEAARAITRVLAEAGIDYAVAGAIASSAHGFERVTTDVDLLVTREGLARFKAAWLGRGYVEVVPGLKAVRDVKRNVKIDFLLTGDFPGDGKPKAVSFPEPARASELRGAYRVLTLAALLELKLASGISAAHRLRDLDDVMRLIRANSLDESYADHLDPSVRSKYLELVGLSRIDDDY